MSETVRKLYLLTAEASGLLEILSAWCEAENIATAQIGVNQVLKILNEINELLDYLD